VRLRGSRISRTCSSLSSFTSARIGSFFSAISPAICSIKLRLLHAVRDLLTTGASAALLAFDIDPGAQPNDPRPVA